VPVPSPKKIPQHLRRKFRAALSSLRDGERGLAAGVSPSFVPIGCK
jgi:hypothetical protein